VSNLKRNVERRTLETLPRSLICRWRFRCWLWRTVWIIAREKFSNSFSNFWRKGHV
jgi:hypothetical protein